MSCDFTEQVSLLIDGELPANEASRVERHVVTCAECQSARADFLNLRRQISDYPINLDPRGQRRALAEILSHRGAAGTRQTVSAGWRERFVAAFGVPRFGTAMATACAVLLVGFVGFMMYRNVHRPQAVVNSPQSDRPAPPTAAVPSTSPLKSGEGTVSPAANKPGSSDKGLIASVPKNQPRERLSSPPPAANNSNPNFVAVNATSVSSADPVSAADAQTLTARHVEQASLLLRAFRNARLEEGSELNHEKNRARQLLYQNILLRREATQKGNVQVANLLDSLEPILIDIANLPTHPAADDVTEIKQRMERKNLVPLLQVNSTQLARAFE